MNKGFFVIVFFVNVLFGQDTLYHVVDSIAKEVPIEFKANNNIIYNEKALTTVFEKLYSLEQNKDRKIRIVHIGDSHIQADLFTAKMRNSMQDYFGNAGFGFTFPYSLANTNNSAPIKYNGSGGFTASKNIHASLEKPVGLSGISLQTSQSNFYINLVVKDTKYAFNSIAIIAPQSQNNFKIALDRKEIKTEEKIAIKKPGISAHKVKPGEVLGSIANKYNISLKQLKKANALKSDNIRDGKILKIPGGKSVTTYKTITTTKYEYVPVDLGFSGSHYNYVSDKSLQEITIIGDANYHNFAINGFVLENDQVGVTYSGIGVNGAKTNDYTKFPLFFEQLPALQADMFVVSLGTNESYDLQSQEVYLNNLLNLLNGIKEKCPNASILVTTPPPSVLHRNTYNNYIESYQEGIIGNQETNNYAVWDLLSVFGGNKNINNNSRLGLMAKDKVHYSKAGYELQGKLLYEAFINAYQAFKSNK
jgi:LysM repeat protein/lysophospholipase L1-like esterase